MSHLKDGLEQSSSKHSCCLKVTQSIAEGRNMTEDQPSCKIDLVCGCIFVGHCLESNAGCFEIPMVEKMKKRLSDLRHDLEFVLAEVMISNEEGFCYYLYYVQCQNMFQILLVENEVCDCFAN